MYVLRNERKENRLGISVSKKNGNSVVRHRITRLIRESYRLNEMKVTDGLDIVVIARPSVRGKSFHEVEKSLLDLLKKHRLLTTRPEGAYLPQEGDAPSLEKPKM